MAGEVEAIESFGVGDREHVSGHVLDGERRRA